MLRLPAPVLKVAPSGALLPRGCGGCGVGLGSGRLACQRNRLLRRVGSAVCLASTY